MISLILDWLVIPLSILVVTGPVAVLVFVALVQRETGSGCFILVFTPLAVLMIFSFLHFRARQLKPVLGSEIARQWLKAGMVLIPLLQLAAPVISFGYGQTCNALNRQIARSLIVALEKHKAET